MSALRPAVVAICCSDLHISLTPPLARNEEPDWLDAQDRQLHQLRELQEEHDVPVLIAGDIFDRWDSPVRLVNWLIPRMPPQCCCIPGQHDLPNHNLDLIRNSAYWTLVEAGCITDISSAGLLKTGVNSTQVPFKVQGFPWGKPLRATKPDDSMLHVALVHAYTWKKGHEYPGAPEEAKVTNMKGLKGWDVVVVGDNHQGFSVKRKGVTVFNCGTFLRRKSNEIGYRPQVGLIHSDGTVESHHLDCSHDKIRETVKTKDREENLELKEFLDELTELQDSSLDFESAMKQVLETKKPSRSVRELITEAME